MEKAPAIVVKINGLLSLQMICENSNGNNSVITGLIHKHSGVKILIDLLNCDELTDRTYSMMEACIYLLERFTANKALLKDMQNCNLLTQMMNLFETTEFLKRSLQNVLISEDELDPFLLHVTVLIRKVLSEAPMHPNEFISELMTRLLSKLFELDSAIIRKILIAEIINLLLAVLKSYPKTKLGHLKKFLFPYEKTNEISQPYSQHDLEIILNSMK